MIADEKQYEFLTSQIGKLADRSIDAFKLFLQIFSAIVGGSIWLSVQGTVTPVSRHRYILLSDAVVVVLSLIVIVMVCDNLRSWFGYRTAVSDLAGTDDSGIDRIGRPHMFPAALSESAILLGIGLVAALFCIANPFSR